jgi:AcrR family transcriptional regulator
MLRRVSANETGGLRERKKLATREALSAAALRLALERGPENVRIGEIAEAAGVSPRTYNNYFSSREQAVVAAIEAERALRIGAALRARPPDEPLADAVIESVVEQYIADHEPGSDAFTLLVSAPGLRAEFLRAVESIEGPLAAAIAARTGDAEEGVVAEVLAAAVSAAARVAAQRWLRPSRGGQVLVVPNAGSSSIANRAAVAVGWQPCQQRQARATASMSRRAPVARYASPPVSAYAWSTSTVARSATCSRSPARSTSVPRTPARP